MAGPEGRIFSMEAPAARPESAPLSFLDRLGIYQPLAWGFPAVLLLMCACGVESGFLSAYVAGQGLSGSDYRPWQRVYNVGFRGIINASSVTREAAGQPAARL